MLLDAPGIEQVVIPIEHGFACRLQLLEEFFFYFIQYVESYEYVFIIFEPASSVSITLR